MRPDTTLLGRDQSQQPVGICKGPGQNNWVLLQACISNFVCFLYSWPNYFKEFVGELKFRIKKVPDSLSVNVEKTSLFYCSPIQDLRVGSKRTATECISIVDNKVIDLVILLVVIIIPFYKSLIIAIFLPQQHGLEATFQHAIEDIVHLERVGFVDPLTNLWLPVIVIAVVGDNLQQNENGTLSHPFLFFFILF